LTAIMTASPPTGDDHRSGAGPSRPFLKEEAREVEMRSTTRYALAAFAAASLLAGCGKARTLLGLGSTTVEVPLGDPTGGPGGPTGKIEVGTCSSCHGTAALGSNSGADPLVAVAPPLDASGLSTSAKVGAHRAHLVDGPFSHAIECSSCHLIPQSGGPHNPTSVVFFSRQATTVWTGGNLTPTYSGGTCAGTYCHGNFKNGANAAPTWTAPAGSVVCGSCHGVSTVNGPGGSHPSGVGTNCGSCHGAGYTSTTVNVATHMNGVLDLANMSCSGCHGDGSRTPVASATATDVDGNPLVKAAPPIDTDALFVSTAVGAHLAHVNQGDTAASGPLSLAIACTSCHPVPTSKAHANGITQVTFGGLAITGGVTPAPYNFGTATCASTYCHGNFTGGLGANALSWKGTTKLLCNGCHAAPPPANATSHHPPNPTCGTCHAGYTGSTVNVSTHVNGTIEHAPATGCTQCHGDVTANGVASTDLRAAPGTNTNAIDAHGSAYNATGQPGVGAHAKHLTSTTFRSSPMACGDCHTVPAAGDVTHANGTGDVPFGGLADTAWSGPPITPTYSRASNNCSGTYCHGNFKNGANATMTWASATPTGVVCGSCHGVSTVNGPGGTHPTGVGANCSDCHGAGYSVNANPALSTVNPVLHMNGALDLPTVKCSGCHGDGSRVAVASATATDVDGNPLVQASPPQDTDALFVSTAVGAHLAHVNQSDTAAPGPLSLAIACTSCHPVPTSKAHANGTTQVTFGGLAVTGGAIPAPYSFGTATCASTYCHGNFNGGLGANPLSWKGTTKLVCNGCHAAPPPTNTSHHPPNPTCATCHSGYTGTTVNASTHVNGTIEHAPATGCTQCHGDVTLNAVANTDSKAAPGFNTNAIDAHGSAYNATGQPGIGAHAKHLTSTTFRSSPMACGDCHTVPAAGDVTHANGTGDVPFPAGGLARTAWGGVTPAPSYSRASNNCSGTYCHGSFKNGNNVTVTWASATPTGVVCGSCHGVSTVNGPGGTHPDITSFSGNCGACHPGYTGSSVNPTLHMNGQLDGGGEPANGGTSCSGCHTTIFASMDGGVVHTSVHNLALDVPTDSATTWGNPLSGVAAASRSCVNMCHADHPHDLTSPVIATHEYNAYADATTQATRASGSATRSAANRAKTDFTTGTGGMCLSCHKNPVDANRPAIAIAAFDASAHDFAQFAVSGGATYTWQYQLHSGNFDRNCTKCHASNVEGTTPAVAATGSNTVAVHFSDNFNLLSGKRNPGGAAAGFVCYNCHGSAASPAAGAQGNRSGKDIQTQIAKTSNHPANADTRHADAAEFNAAAFGNALGVSAGSGQRHASCLDCHDSHGVKAGTHAQGTNVAGPPLEGSWGVAFVGTLAAGAVPTSANFTKKAIVAGTDLEATLCFKCHSAFYGTLPNSASGGYGETDQAREFNTANLSMHPILATAPNPTGNVINLNGWSTTSLMTCTDCHESNSAADPNGPHGSSAGFILKGPNTTWNTTLALLSTGMPAGTFCANCHASNYAGSRFPQHLSSVHRGTQRGSPVYCTSCHVRIPHGSGHRGLLVSVGTAGTAEGQVFSDGTPWASTPRLGISSYPTGTNSWSNNNCGCDSVSIGH
jgi:predicted CxxxxCH...CXXCH cytochrome family protein